MSLQISVELNDTRYQINIENSWSLAIAVNFNQATQQPNHFSAKAALASPMQAGSFIGDTQQGGSCNVNELTINPHCNGTHTESIAHICHYAMNTPKENDTELATHHDEKRALTLAQLNIPALMPCAVISITPELALKSDEHYRPDFYPADAIISRTLLKKACRYYNNEQLQALVIRTLPNDKSKCQQAYSPDNQPAFFSREAILYLNERGVEHLVVDLPSIDRLHDEGLMTCHHLFWQVAQGSHQMNNDSLTNKTITEMAFIDNDIADGFYFINIQSPAFHNDAAPSRPVIFAAKEFSAKEVSK
ncbi:cyclase family protein [Colwellia hornerae]|nr:cyclase family protein [Colwellia hornerae]